MGEGAFPQRVKKRDGTIVPFDKTRIQRAIERAAFEVLQDTSKANAVSERITTVVLREVSASFRDTIPDVESIQDSIEAALMREGYGDIARSYIVYREKRSEIRRAKSALDLKDDVKLPINALEVLRNRYLLKDDDQNIIETPSELFKRVASAVAQAEANFKSNFSPAEVEERFYHLMRNLDFLPNSPTFMNAGTPLGQLSACFVVPVEDSIDGIFDALKHMANIHQTGGGTGFDFSHLRPRGDLVASTKGRASGPVSFMGIFDKATRVIVQGGRRRGANMGILRCDHPDIVDFVEAKREGGAFSNFNLSVGVTDTFMEAIKGDKKFDLINPRTKRRTGRVKAKALFDLIVSAAWRTGDPGLVFLDEINRRNPTPRVGPIEATNPCGELPLLPYESCNLASINLAKMVTGDSVNWDKLKECIRWGVRFLDDVIEVNTFPLPEIREITHANRKIGLGVMGFADMLIHLGIPYNSSEALRFAGDLMSFVHKQSLDASIGLAEERGVFPNFHESIYRNTLPGLRNATTNTVAPTGTISIVAGCSSGIEPLFAITFVRNVLSGTKLFETNPIFEDVAKRRGFFTEEIVAEAARRGSLRNVNGVPKDAKRIFVTAFDIRPEDHLKIQSAFQAHTDNSVSKTINLPFDSTIEDVRRIYLMAHRLACKGITIYRYGSQDEQVLSFDYSRGGGARSTDAMVAVGSEYAGGCALDACPY